MNVLTSDTSPLSAADLHQELDGLMQRILFVD
jgi:hypothetical protein